MSATENTTEVTPTAAEPLRRRNIAYARVWTAQRAPISVAALADELYARGIVPGFTDPEAQRPPLTDAGLTEVSFAVGGEGFRILSQQSSKGLGCTVAVRASDASDLPDDLLARRTVSRPKLCYVIEAGGPANSDRSLCENLAEVIMVMAEGIVEIGGLGTKGNRPNLYKSRWIGDIHAR